MSKPPIRVTVVFDPDEMARRGRLGACALHRRYDAMAITEKAREAFAAKFLAEVDPDRQLSQAEREKRATDARRRYFSWLGQRSAEARRQRSEGGHA